MFLFVFMFFKCFQILNICYGFRFSFWSLVIRFSLRWKRAFQPWKCQDERRTHKYSNSILNMHKRGNIMGCSQNVTTFCCHQLSNNSTCTTFTLQLYDVAQSKKQNVQPLLTQFPYTKCTSMISFHMLV